MKRLTIYTIQLISGLLLALLTAGCVADRNVSDCVAEGEEVELEFALQVPALETSLRQLSEVQEKQINSIQVLVFNTDGIPDESQETFAYEAEVKNKTQEGNTIRIRCGLKASSKPMRVVCIANANIDTKTKNLEGTTKQVILESDQMKQTFTKKWLTDGTQFIPMWGESDKQAVSRTTKFNSCEASNANGVNTKNEGVIHLVRALARIDVGVKFADEPTSEKATGSETFKIQSVRVYRYAQSMYVTGTQATTFRQMGPNREPLPHTPEGMRPADDTNPLVFTAENEEDAKGYVRNIYIPEISNHLDNGQNKDKNARTCLVIGGYYNGSTKETYYRVDFIKREDGKPEDKITKQLDVLRNHRYRFNITDVKGPGTDNPGDALITEPVNITCDVVVWDEADIDKIMYDGQYYLSVSKDKFSFGKDATSESYTIRTNWPKGYEIVDKDGNKWATTKDEATTQNTWAYFTEPTGQTFEIDKDMTSTVNVLDNATGEVRTITTKDLFVKAGRIKWPLQITQSDKIELDVKVYHKESESWQDDCTKLPINAYTCVPGTEYFFWVKYTDGGALGRIAVDTEEQFQWTKLSDDSKNGIALYKVVAKADDIPLDQFWLSELSKFRVTKDGAEKLTDFTLNYMKWDAIPYKDPNFTRNLLDPDNEPVYVLGDFNQRIYIRANAPYNLTVTKIEIEKISGEPDPKHVVRDWHEGKLIQEKEQPRFVDGEPLDFRTYDYVSDTDPDLKGDIVSAVVTLLITPKANPGEADYFEKHQFRLHFVAGILQPEANTYVVEAGQIPVLIPCSQLNKAADWWNNWSTEMEKVMEKRKNSGGEPGISNAVYKNYMAAGGWTLPRLEPDDKDWTAQCVWSSLTSDGKNSGLQKVEAVQIDLGGRNYILVQPKDEYEGVALVSAVKGYNTRQPKILWNWTIWVVKKIANGGHGYPWDDADNRTAGAPYMNRNLGAYRMASERSRGAVYDKFNNDMCGLFYKHGTQVPHHAYEYVGKNESEGPSHCTKVWYDKKLVPAEEQTRMSPTLYGMTISKTMCSMRDIIDKPTQMIFRELVSEYILELGTTEWGSFQMDAMWMGGDGKTVLNNESNFNLFNGRTEKTPFDPSPYGWKVPAAGRESKEMCEHPNLFFARNGAYLKGIWNNLNTQAQANGPVLHCATRYSNTDALVLNYYDLPGQKWTHTTNGGILAGGDYKTYASTQLPIRCIENEAESDYRDYTQDAIMQNARSATRAARRYHR